MENPLTPTRAQTARVQAERVLRFGRALLTLTSVALELGQRFRAFSDPSLPHFRKLSPEEQTRLLEGLELYVGLLQATRVDGDGEVSDSKFLWRMLGELGMRSAPGMFEQLADGDITEIFDMNGRPLFRSFEFFGFCTYTLEELFCRPWLELYERDEAVQRGYLGYLDKLASGELSETFAPDIPAHEVREKKSSGCRAARVVPRFISPLFDSSGNVAGLVNVFRVL